MSLRERTFWTLIGVWVIALSILLAVTAGAIFTRKTRVQTERVEVANEMPRPKPKAETKTAPKPLDVPVEKSKAFQAVEPRPEPKVVLIVPEQPKAEPVKPLPDPRLAEIEADLAATKKNIAALARAQIADLERQAFQLQSDRSRLTKELVDVLNRYPSGSPNFSYARIDGVKNRIRENETRTADLYRQIESLSAKLR
jgi:ABC-type Na+ efflux pump permease subunit